MIRIRRSDDRGHADHGWLVSQHTFSFASYWDPEHMGFGPLRVINDDRVEPGKGFGTHPHRDMEIISYVVEGALEHRDSMGNGSVIRPGEVQLMSAGSGVTHSEFNPSEDELVRFLQIWIEPRTKGTTPRYEQRSFSAAERRGRWRPLVSADGQADALRMDQDASLFGALLAPEESVEYELAPERKAWVQVVSGCARLNGEVLLEGDGAAIADERLLVVQGEEDAELLLFDLP